MTIAIFFLPSWLDISTSTMATHAVLGLFLLISTVLKLLVGNDNANRSRLEI